jgi:hypothetical protein
MIIVLGPLTHQGDEEVTREARCNTYLHTVRIPMNNIYTYVAHATNDANDDDVTGLLLERRPSAPNPKPRPPTNDAIDDHVTNTQTLHRHA